MRLADGTYDNDEKWMEAQEKWLETHDEKYLFEMFPYYLHAIKSCMVKRLKGMWINSFNEKAEAAALYQMEYHKKHPDRKIDRLMGWASFLCMRALYSKESKNLDNECYNTSYESYIENLGNECASYDSFEDDLIEKLTKEGY